VPDLHPLNDGFTWVDHAGPFRAVTDTQAQAYDRDGFFLFEDALTSAQVEAMQAEIDPVEAEVEALIRDAGGTAFIYRADEITFTTHLVTRSPILRAMVAAAPFTDLAADLLGPEVRLYWDQAVYKKPGTDAPFPWHQDNGYAFVVPQQYLTCWVALTDVTEDNGCPWVVPGHHRRGTLAHWPSDLGFVCLEEAPDAVPVPARAGSIVVFSSLTPHSTGANRTDEVRKAYIVQYAPDGARTLAADGSVAGACDDPDRQYRISSREPPTRH
jgi:ectoine hydroxylase-related dioxygenase (phytanoyl-CoA dioxygenase family)